MKRTAVIGSGIAGLLTAHGLRKAGYEVTLFSDRTPEQWLRESRPTGAAGRFEPALAYERELGLAHWEREAPKVEGVHLTFCAQPGNRLATLTGRLEKFGLAVDVRLQSHRWMLDLEARGGRVVIEDVTVARLDAIAAEHDLTIVAAGKGELGRLFPRHPERSVYDEPQRNLAMVLVKGPRFGFDGVPFTPVKFNLFGGVGEAFWVPYHHALVGPSWCLLFEAVPGGPMDVFQGAKSGAEVLRLAEQTMARLTPWDHAWAQGMELADERGFLVGAFAPTVREPVGRLPSGRIVTSVGDTAMLFDPVGGQGANNGTRMARHLVASIVARGDEPFDEAWMRATFERYWEEHGRAAYAFNNILLEPMTPAGQELLIAQYGSDGVRRDGQQAIADAFTRNFVDPRQLTHLLDDVGATRRRIAEITGGSWLRYAAAGRLGIAREQLRQRLGLPPRHPAAAAPAEAAPVGAPQAG